MKIAKIAFILLALTACTNNPPYAEQKDDDMTIQVLEYPDNDPSEIRYGLRLLPTEKLKQTIHRTQVANMQYRADSLFTLVNGDQKLIPVSVQYVANGSKSIFEYILVFEDDDHKVSTRQLIYTDKFLTGKTYTIKLTKG